MKKVLIGTTNPSKIRRFRTLLADYDVEFCTLKDLGIDTEPNETGTTPEENAALKAAYYGQFFDLVLCNDSGLFFEGLPLDDKRQPGLKIRSPQGKRLNDEEVIEYYSQLVHSLGGKCTAYYLDGYAVYNHGKTFSFMMHDMSSAFDMVDCPTEKRHEGWPLDALSVDKQTGLYFTDKEYMASDEEKDEIIRGEYRKKVSSFLAEHLGIELK